MRGPRANQPLGLLVAVSVAVLVVLAGEALLGAVTVGITIDEQIHVSRFSQWLDNGLYVPWFLITDGEPNPARPIATPYVYGAVFSGLGHLANVVLGNEGIGEISSGSDAYAVRHLVVAAMGLAAAVAAGLAVRAITADRLAGLWSGAALLAIPVWTGNAMFNIKDVPAGAGYTLVTAGLAIALARLGEGESSRLRRWGPGVLVGIGVLVGVGTRFALWVPLGCSLAAFAAVSWLLLGSVRRTLSPLAAPALGFAAGLALVVALHPELARTPIDWLIGSVSDSGNFKWQGYTLTAGSYLEGDPPFWYLPAWAFAGIPLLVFGLAVLGVGVYARRGLAMLRRKGAVGLSAAARTAAVALVALQLALLPLAATVANSPMYGGLRQHLYVLPAVAMLAGLGAASLIGRIREATGAPGWRRWAVAAVLALALVAPAVEQTRLYPYNYAYVNPLAGIRGVQGEWETELQWISSREAFQRVPRGVEPACSSWLEPSHGAPVEAAIDYDCDAAVELYRDEIGEDASAAAQPGEVWLVGRTRSANRPPDYCREADSVTRPLRGEEVVMSYVLLCTPPREAGAAPPE